jgi:CRP-like cAMP-binding protein
MLPRTTTAGVPTLERVMATHTDEKLELLKRTPLLAGLGRKDIEEVGRLVDEVDLKAGYVLMREGDIGREFFVIIDGQVRIDKGGQTIRTMGPGQFLGDIALVTEGPRTATATTETACRLLVLGHGAFHQLMDQYPSIRLSVLESMAMRLRDLEPEVVH